MRSVLSIIGISIIISACTKNTNDNASPELTGEYAGTFNRTGVADTASVVLKLRSNHFQGQSDKEKYPAICRGSYDISQSSISFVDSCAWTADFDWTFILNGTYNISFQPGNAMRVWRTNGTVVDEYLLHKIER